jgi:type VI protein secretion system component VasK
LVAQAVGRRGSLLLASWTEKFAACLLLLLALLLVTWALQEQGNSASTQYVDARV